MKWDYLVCDVDEHNLNSLGEIGWELIAVENNKAYFKRPKQDTSLPAEQTEYFGGKVG